MASRAAIGIMREAAYSRLEAVATQLLGARGLKPSPYQNLSKDPDIAVVRTLEAIAGDLETLTEADGQAAEAEEPAGES